MTRQEEILEGLANSNSKYENNYTFIKGFKEGAKWADKHPLLPWTTLKETPLTPEPRNVKEKDVEQWCLCEYNNADTLARYFIGYYGVTPDGSCKWYNQVGASCCYIEDVRRFILLK